jgi:uncharacterized membrane protein (UPF0127 family)
MRLIPFIILIAVVLILIFSQPAVKQTIQLKTNDKTYNLLVEIAKTPDEQAEGLMGRENLSDNEGMLFVYKTDVTPSFWMKNMEIPLDILFIGSDYEIKHIAPSVPPCNTRDDNCIRYPSPSPIRYVLELQSGFAEKYDVQVGNSIVLNQ